MSDKEQNKINDNRDELLKSALSVNLSKELPTKEEEQQRHAFSVDFAIRIKDLIGDADKIIEENQNAVSAAAETGEKTESRSAEIDEVPVETAETTARTSETDGKSGEETSAETEKITAEPEEQTETAKEPIAETDETAAEETEAADRTATKTGRGRSRAEAAQERMTGQVIPASFLRRHRKAIVNAASLVLVFGIGVFFLKEGGALLGGGSEANKAAAQSEQETPAVSEDTAEGGQEQRPLTETAAADTGNSQPAANSAEENDLPETVSDRTAERSVSDAGGQAETTGRTAEPQEAAARQRTQSETKARSQSSEEAQNRTGKSSRSGNIQNGTEGSSRSRTAQSGTRKQSGKTQSSSRNTGSGTNGRTNSSTDGTAAETQGSQSKTAGKAANETGTAPSGTAGGTTAGTVPNEAAAGNVTKETAAAGNNQGQQSSAADETNAVGGVQLPNPIRKISGPEEFAKQLGFSLSVYPTAAERTDTEYSLISNKTAQICYYSETIDSKMVFRAEKKETLLADLPEQERKPGEAELGEDVWRMLSGIYYPFDESRTEFWTVKGENGEPDIPITVRIVESEESSGALATWEKDGVLYTLWAEDASRHRNAVGKEAKNLIELADVQSPSV